jgi:hypothetical protein
MYRMFRRMVSYADSVNVNNMLGAHLLGTRFVSFLCQTLEHQTPRLQSVGT